ncbi:MAG: hypothetical protein ABI728_09770, partial [Betaproteobacteria bacterium]
MFTVNSAAAFEYWERDPASGIEPRINASVSSVVSLGSVLRPCPIVLWAFLARLQVRALAFLDRAFASAGYLARCRVVRLDRFAGARLRGMLSPPLNFVGQRIMG